MKQARFRFFLIFGLSVVALLGLMQWGLLVGAVSDLDWKWIWQIRAPRVALAAIVGFGLVVAGISLQSLFSNPLCEPYTLGVSSGAALGAVVLSNLVSSTVLFGLESGAVVGSLVFAFVLFLVSQFRGVSQLTLLLAGVMLGFLGSSLVALWMTFQDAAGIQGALSWLMGDLSRARWSGVIVTFILVLVTTVFIYRKSTQLDRLLLGPHMAKNLGVNVPRLQRTLIVLSSVLVGACVSSAGMIGFVGLVVPHLCRKWVGSQHGVLIPVAGMVGAGVLVLADLVSRSLFSPHEIPIGVVSALVGAPFFLGMMLNIRGGAVREV